MSKPSIASSQMGEDRRSLRAHRHRDGQLVCVGVRTKLPLIRDTEIEGILADYARPLFKAAGLGSGRIKMRIVQNDAFNAFVLDGRNVFVHTGTLTQANSPNEVIGVIAHETGHITGGHMAALRARIAKDQTRALLAQILGIGSSLPAAYRATTVWAAPARACCSAATR